MAWCLCCCSWTTDIWREPQIHADLPTTNSFCPTPVGTHRNLWWISPSNLAVQFIEWHIMQGAANQWWTSWSPACGNFINVYHPSFSHGRKYLLCSELYLETSISVEELSKKYFYWLLVRGVLPPVPTLLTLNCFVSKAPLSIWYITGSYLFLWLKPSMFYLSFHITYSQRDHRD